MAFLSVCLAVVWILTRGLFALSPSTYDREESGWKLVHADVFRPPTDNPMLLTVFVGTGAQLFFMCLVTIAFAAVGFLSPANRGSLMIAVLLTYVLMGSVAGE